MFILVVCGFFLRKKEIIPENTGATLSKLETHLLIPALNLFNQMTKCNVETFKESFPLILYGGGVTLFSVVLAYPLSRLFVPNYKQSSELSYERNIFKYAMAFANYGYLGNYIILGVWGSDMFFKYQLFCFLPSIVCGSWGLYNLIPKNSDSLLQNMKKGLLTPPTIALLIGMAAGLLNVKEYIPDFISTALSDLGDCMGPVAMVITGVVIGGYNFGEIIKNKKIYFASIIRIVVLPSIIVFGLEIFGVNEDVMLLAFICFASALGLNTIVYPAAYGGNTKTGASMAVISNTLAIAMIPIMYLVLFVLI